MSVAVRSYQRYQGPRRQPSPNAWVLWRFAFAKGWQSWYTRVAVALGWVPAVVGVAALAGELWVRQQTGSAAALAAIDHASWLRSAIGWQIWVALTLVALGVGQGLMASAQRGAFDFYFSKPIGLMDYMVARVAATASWVLMAIWLPMLVLNVALVAVALPGRLAAEAWLAVPTAGLCALVALVVAAMALVPGALTARQGIATVIWLGIVLVPQALGGLVSVATHQSWPMLLSVSANLRMIADAWLTSPAVEARQLGYASLSLLAMCVGSAWICRYRLRQAAGL